METNDKLINYKGLSTVANALWTANKNYTDGKAGQFLGSITAQNQLSTTAKAGDFHIVSSQFAMAYTNSDNQSTSTYIGKGYVAFALKSNPTTAYSDWTFVPGNIYEMLDELKGTVDALETKVDTLETNFGTHETNYKISDDDFDGML